MTGDEIITALGFLKILVCNTDTQRQVVISTIDFINSQNTKIEELESMYKQERADRLYLSQQNKSIIAGQETLQRALSDEIAKNEELKNQDMVVIRGQRGCGKTKFVAEKIRDSINRIRAEAIEEFAERLKAEAKLRNHINYGANKQAVSYNEGVIETRKFMLVCIDNLVKEMVGEK